MDDKMKQEILESWVSWKHDIKDMNRSEWNQRDQSIMDAIEIILRKELDDNGKMDQISRREPVNIIA